MSDSVELRPCPFCGREAEIERHGTSRQSTIVSCTDCGCVLEGPEEFKHGRQWNTRTTRTTDPLLDEMAEVIGKIEKYYDFTGEVLEEIAPEWLTDVIQVMQKYREQHSLTHPNPQPPKP